MTDHINSAAGMTEGEVTPASQQDAPSAVVDVETLHQIIYRHVHNSCNRDVAREILEGAIWRATQQAAEAMHDELVGCRRQAIAEADMIAGQLWLDLVNKCDAGGREADWFDRRRGELRSLATRPLWSMR